MPTKIHIPEQELWDETRDEFIPVKERTLSLEHSLVSLSKWESKWHKPFLSPEEKTREELTDYIRCMILDDLSDEELETIIYALTPSDIKQVEQYLAEEQTATKFPEEKNNPEPQSNELMTSELIYYYLGQIQCPFIPTENWNLSRVLTLIRVGSFKSKPEKKLNQKEALQQCEDINERNKRIFDEMRRKAEQESKKKEVK